MGLPGATALASGTAALHLAMKLARVGEGDYVFCSSLTFSASANPIVYENATPVFIDSEPGSYNMSPVALEKAFEKYTPKAVVIVSLYGMPATMDKLIKICKKHKVTIIEDAAESLGATYKGRLVGTFGEYNIISFNGNKIITTSGGGMLLTKKEKDDGTGYEKSVKYTVVDSKGNDITNKKDANVYLNNDGNIYVEVKNYEEPEIHKGVKDVTNQDSGYNADEVHLSLIHI